MLLLFFFFFQAEDGIRDKLVTGVQTCALPIYLPRAGLFSGDRIRYSQAQVVVAMYADHGAIAQDLDDAANDSAIFVGRREPDRVRNIHSPRASGDHGLRNLLQKIGLGAGAVFSRKLYIIDMAPRQLDGGDCFVERLILRLLELV